MRISGMSELIVTSGKTNTAERAGETQSWAFRRLWNEEHYQPLREETHPADFE